eukprot:s397_g60.t1
MKGACRVLSELVAFQELSSALPRPSSIISPALNTKFSFPFSSPHFCAYKPHGRHQSFSYPGICRKPPSDMTAGPAL